MSRIQQRTRNLEPAFHLVSISVDPAYDDPGRLAVYGRAHGASPRMWTFLTGRIDAFRGIASEPGSPTHLVLVDGQSRIRAYYDPEERDAVERVVRDAALLVNRG
jgi:protein SCO1/2